jgi:Protein of unknown function (DUF2857)
MSDSGFTLQTILHIVRMAAEGDIRTAIKLGIKEHQITELLTLNSQELHDMASMTHSKFIKIEFDPDALETALRINEKHSKRRQEIMALIAAGASYPVMKHLYGLTTEDMANYKKLAGITDTDGRPANATEQEQQQLWKIMKPIQSLDDPELPELLIKAHKKTGVKVNSIWLLLKEWRGKPGHINEQ